MPKEGREGGWKGEMSARGAKECMGVGREQNSLFSGDSFFFLGPFELDGRKGDFGAEGFLSPFSFFLERSGLRGEDAMVVYHITREAWVWLKFGLARIPLNGMGPVGVVLFVSSIV